MNTENVTYAKNRKESERATADFVAQQQVLTAIGQTKTAVLSETQKLYRLCGLKKDDSTEATLNNAAAITSGSDSVQQAALPIGMLGFKDKALAAAVCPSGDMPTDSTTLATWSPWSVYTCRIKKANLLKLEKGYRIGHCGDATSASCNVAGYPAPYSTATTGDSLPTNLAYGATTGPASAAIVWTASHKKAENVALAVAKVYTDSLAVATAFSAITVAPTKATEGWVPITAAATIFSAQIVGLNDGTVCQTILSTRKALFECLQTAAAVKLGALNTAKASITAIQVKIDGLRANTKKCSDTACASVTDTTSTADADGLLKLKETLKGSVAKCKSRHLDDYYAELTKARTGRITSLEALITLEKEDATAAAVKRCEKPLGWKKERGDMAKLCGASSCCGAAKGNVNGAVLTIEACGATTATTFAYVTPRSPMGTTAYAARATDAKSVSFTFACIDGAARLAAATGTAAALAAAYLMA